jgi:hypothetical protein
MEQREQPKIEQEISSEKAEELRLMKERIERSLEDEETRAKVTDDFSYTFERLGLSPDDAKKLCDNVFALLKAKKPLPDIEAETLRIFENIKLKVGDKEPNLIEILHEKLRDRAKIIASQVAPHLGDVKEKAIDYGAGDGQVTQMLHDQLGLDIEGVDVRLYKAPNVTVPIMLFNGGHVEAADGTYEAALLTNVLHHEKANEKIFDELDRIVRRKLVILETVPVGETEEVMEQDKDRTFMNDYLYNRLFHSADVPVPGTFETPKKWVDRFAQHGWKLVNEEDLGFDQPTIKDRHYLLVFEK